MEKQIRIIRIRKVLFYLVITSLLLLGFLHVYNNYNKNDLASSAIPGNIEAETALYIDAKDLLNFDFFNFVNIAYADEVNGSPTITSITRQNTYTNEPFTVTNMFPGDFYTKEYAVIFTHSNALDLYFDIFIQEPYLDEENRADLAEVLKVRILRKLDDTTSVTLYDGLMKDMPELIQHIPLNGDSSTTVALYSVSAYLDTSVGNDYQNKELMADFKWWIDEDDSGDIDDPFTPIMPGPDLIIPDTSVHELTNSLFPWGVAVFLGLGLYIYERRKKEDAR